MAQDLKYAFRQLQGAKWSTATAALTLALGIGATTVVFAVLETVVLRPLPFAQSERLMSFRSIDRRGTPHPTNLSYPNFFDFRAQNRVFDHLVSYRAEDFSLTDDPAIRVAGEIVSWDLFPLLGVQPEQGRGFLPEEEKPGTHVAILSHALWNSRFGGDRGIIGKRVGINGRLFTVVGVAPAGFQFPLDRPAVDVWTTLSEDATVSEFTPLTKQRGARAIDTIGQLKAGVPPQQAQAQMDQIASALARQYPDDNKNLARTLVVPELERLVGGSRKVLWILLGAVGMVLLIACANVANLLLARSTGRAGEFALRSALGASRRALVRQLLTESLLLGALGSMGGIMLAAVAVKFVLPLAGGNLPIPRIAQVAIDLRVLGFSVFAAFVTSILFGLAPAAQLLERNLIGALKTGTTHIASGRHRLRGMLIAGQIALGLVLLVGAELLIASFLHLVRRDPGFRPDHLLTFAIGLPEGQYNNAGQISFNDRLLDGLRAIPGVQAAASGMPLPLEGHQMSVSFDIEERPKPVPDRPHCDIAIVTPGYFGAMGIHLREGRDFSEQDTAMSPRVVIVNEAFASKYFPGEDPIGKRIAPGATNGPEEIRLREIVGVVANAKQEPGAAELDPIYYFPYRQLSWGFGTIVIRTTIAPHRIEIAARAALAGLDKEVPMFQVRTGEELSSAAIAIPRFLTALMVSFAGIALLLTVVGLYSVLAYAVARRQREIGVRIALGAGPRAVRSLVLREAMRPVVFGLVLGLASATGVERLFESVVFDVQPRDPLFVTIACSVLLIASMAAAYLPARRATSIDPVRTLRSE